MAKTLFLIGIGGTGMRCLEAFVHTCAMGMYDDAEVNILALDTDLDNGNFTRLKELVQDCYMKVKGYGKDHYKNKDSFFSAKINLYTFTPDYSDASKNGSFEVLSKLPYADGDKKALAEILLNRQVREFDLKHGYRAQTHLGSLLMYHAIIDEVKKNRNGKLGEFIKKLYESSESSDTRVFILGSVFGGTGASSIPIIPKAFDEAVGIINEGKRLTKASFGATLLSAYFKFAAPDDDARARQKIVATSKNFALNSQIAMMFYNQDLTVKSVFQKFYMLGTPSNDFDAQGKQKDVVTGGALQKNDSHYIELMAAFAAYDFFNTPEPELLQIKEENKGVQYYYRTISDNGRLDFKDFVSPDTMRSFAQKFGGLVAMSYIINLFGFADSAKSGNLAKNNISGYEDIESQEVDGLKKYFEMFHFKLSADGLEDGWLRQLHRSAGGQDKFLFNAELFGSSNEKELRKFEFNKKLYRSDESDVDVYSFKTSLFFGSPFDSFKDEFVKQRDDDSISYKIEKLIKRMYDTIYSLYGFKK